MNPGRLCVGEVRGAEALELLKAWTSGHEGGFATVHANACAGGVRRLAVLAELGLGRAIPAEWLADALEICNVHHRDVARTCARIRWHPSNQQLLGAG
jgi:type IV secretion system protein VirB11